MTGAATRAVITGMGAITPSGLDVESLWAAVSAGRSAIDVLEGAEFDALPVRIGGQVRGFDPAGVIEPALARRLSPVHHWALAAASQALAQAGARDALPWDPERVGVIAATGSGPIDAMQQATRTLDARGPRAVPLTLSVYGAPDAAAALISQRYGITGPAQGLSATCASGAIALGEALRRVRHGYADAVLVVGMEDCLNAVNLASNANLRALAKGYEGAPTTASRPFDRGRSGFVMSQGAGAILVESDAAARARGAGFAAEIAGFGASSDAHHPTAPDPEGRGGARAVRAALADAGIGPADIDHINAHGTGTEAGDAAELRALQGALGDRARGIPLTATKSSTGHLLGASGVIEAIIAVQTLGRGILPPTINLDDPAFPEWNTVTTPMRQSVHTVLSTSFGFGGHNGALVIREAIREAIREPIREAEERS
ncbi:beta-ketoacyl-[acyl-carrier-protein] synthase family protein [Microbacterium sp.]|uniref:beta-ketoacyl-[acyl-carrier-protein] synthase family protein n=1 Tax=Microbacterium sp. TaxID=51671 RepID=UPI003A8DB214